jgi:hypothetical protein
VPGGTGGKAEGVMVRRVFGAGVALLMTTGTLIGIVANAASADPTRHGELITLECEVLGTFDIVTNGNGQWTPGHVADGTQVVVPYSFRFEFTPPGGETEVFEVSKHAPANGRLDVCTFTIEDPEGTLNGTARVSYTPA